MGECEEGVGGRVSGGGWWESVRRGVVGECICTMHLDM